MSLPEYEGKTFGAISLLGDEQAGRIQELIQQLTPLADLDRRRFVSGNPAQFQGDERDVVFLSMVDVSDGHVLPMQERLSFKQRYNVGASRARDQLWLVHCLDPEPRPAGRRPAAPPDRTRAQPGRAHGSSPGMRPRAQSPFEADVTERLRAHGLRHRAAGRHRRPPHRHRRVRRPAPRGHRLRGRPAQVARADRRGHGPPGRARAGRLALHPGAGHPFFRDRDGIMDGVARELKRLGVEPLAEPAAPPPAATPAARTCATR